MPVRSWHFRAIALLVTLTVGCSAASPASSVVPSTQPTAGGSEGQAGDLPTGCEPAPALKAPDGSTVILDGTWTAETHTSSLPETWWFRTVGDCLWGAGAVGARGDAELFDSPDPGRVQTLRGTIGRDFVVEGEIIRVATPGFATGFERPYSPLRLLIEFDADGTVVLREDREYGVGGPRCGDPNVFCIPVLVLRPADESAE
jgi:hypothetical protein